MSDAQYVSVLQSPVSKGVDTGRLLLLSIFVLILAQDLSRVQCKVVVGNEGARRGEGPPKGSLRAAPGARAATLASSSCIATESPRTASILA